MTRSTHLMKTAPGATGANDRRNQAMPTKTNRSTERAEAVERARRLADRLKRPVGVWKMPGGSLLVAPDRPWDQAESVTEVRP